MQSMQGEGPAAGGPGRGHPTETRLAMSDYIYSTPRDTGTVSRTRRRTSPIVAPLHVKCGGTATTPHRSRSKSIHGQNPSEPGPLTASGSPAGPTRSRQTPSPNGGDRPVAQDRVLPARVVGVLHPQRGRDRTAEDLGPGAVGGPRVQPPSGSTGTYRPSKPTVQVAPPSAEVSISWRTVPSPLGLTVIR